MKLDKLSLDELKVLEVDVRKAITSFEARRRKDALDAADAKAREFGFTLKDLLGATPAKSRKGGLPAKYVHPENPALTWSGHGRRPSWIKDGLENGKSLDSFLMG